ncbi:hypothetical protein [Mucilaginibacter boryungensis]|uniref:MFS transporter n=1 Tax=Mucilaginibacter boryungensis TaxID=768480 RepID=A0ABR9XFS4_9SPHI|nr:hypothetical protein [Mucilaginibacter boryungensis]MBE9665878.1 hypothetical protein [Mucilaginibacter boryungensis]
MNTYNRTPILNPRLFFKLLTIIYFALLAGQLLFGATAFAITQAKGFNLTTRDPLVLVVPITTLGCFVAGSIVYKQLLNLAANKSTLNEKLMCYQSAFIARLALLEGPSLFGIVAYLLSGNLFFLAISGLIVLNFIAIKPTRDKVGTDLNLDYQEKAEISGTI